MKKILLAIAFACFLYNAGAQVLSLDSCRALALRNNKQLNISKLKQDVALNVRKSARTKYLPKIDGLGGYEYTSKEISLLNDREKSTLSNLGTSITSGLGNNISSVLTQLVQQGLITSDMAQNIGSYLSQGGSLVSNSINQVGQGIVNDFKTDTKNIWVGAVMVRQPVFMGGAIIAANKMADITEDMAANDYDLKRQNTLYNIDQAYWTVVSLKQKQKLAHKYRDLVKKLDDDVYKMIKEQVATKSDGLRVDVKVNEADMDITKVENGLVLAKMYLCQLCGLPMDSDITLEDENSDNLQTLNETESYNPDSTFNNRPEIRLLENTIEMSKQNTNLIRAGYLPHVMLTGGYLISNPNVFNGFQRKFSGVWNIGVTVQVPLWNWFDGVYKVRASKNTTSIAQLELMDAQEKINLQYTQSQFRVNEAFKRYAMAEQDMKSAEENLRCANLGFKEGVMNITDVLEAQTAWQKALSQKIDAQIDVKMSQVNLRKALGILN